jgi:hypothetical protein
VEIGMRGIDGVPGKIMGLFGFVAAFKKITPEGQTRFQLKGGRIESDEGDGYFKAYPPSAVEKKGGHGEQTPVIGNYLPDGTLPVPSKTETKGTRRIKLKIEITAVVPDRGEKKFQTTVPANRIQ